MREASLSWPNRRFAPRATVLAAAAAAAVAVLVGLVAAFTPVLAGIEQDTLAARFGLRHTPRPAGVVLVKIDDPSFAALRHRWPFPRSWHGRVLEALHRAGARVVFYDLQFTEPTTPHEDGALFNALADTGGAVLATTETDGHGHSGVLGGDANLALAGSRAADSEFPVSLGGVISRVPYSLGGGLLTPALAVAQRLGHRLPGRSSFAGAGALIDFRGPPGTFPSLSFAQVLSGHFPASAVRGQVVVVGATSNSLQDMHSTPVDPHSLMSGPEIQANAIWTVLHGLPLRPAPGLLVVGLILLAGVAVPLVRARRSALAAVLVSAGGAVVYLIGAQLSFDAGLVVPVIAPLATLATGFLATLLASHLLVTLELRATQLEIIHRLGRVAESRDGETGRHLERMGFLCERLALAAGLSRREARLLRQASVLHDVGKIAIPDAVLMKPGRFEDSDHEVMRTHADLGADMLAGSSTSLVRLAEVIARTHHERWDGTGYPAGLAGEQIPLAGRICAICDVFDALVNARRYKHSWTLAATLTELEQGAGTHFDPDLTALFVGIAPRLYRELATRVDPEVALDAPAGEPPDDAFSRPSPLVAPSYSA